jgi:O6-methylguanine-DNA--protein-cysteine methyltransferase
MDTNAIINAAMQQLVTTVADEVIRKLKAEGMATVSLEPEALEASLIALFIGNAEVRESIRDITSDLIDNINLSDNSEFQDLERQVSRLDEKLDELEATPVDADDSDFQDAVRSVIRNHI